MERASNTLKHIVVAALTRLPAAELPAAAWDFSSGNVVSGRTRVLGCENKTLVVEVPDANWRAQLYAMTPQFLAQLNQFIPVERIEFKLARPQDEKRKS